MIAQLVSITVGWAVSIGPLAGTDTERPPDRTDRSLAVRYQGTADRIIRATLAGNEAQDKLEELCLGIGQRLSGSPQLDQAIEWAIATMKEDGQENVRRERVMVPRWVRGRESATMLEPRVEPLHMLGLGGSVGTPPEGITASVVVVADEKELEALGEKARGKIVLFNNPMQQYDPKRGAGYGTAVRFRYRGAPLAAEHGAVASLIRSVTARSLCSPHTGGTSYGDAAVKVPAAALAIEDAEMISRFQKRGIPVVVTLKMEAETHSDVPSGNVIGELRGRERPDEVVVIGGHLDSWDVGQGAHDDAGGCVVAMEAVNVLRRLEMIPRRTIRVVLWTAEETGIHGGKAYATDHADEMDKHVAAIEMDGGAFEPTGYSVECADSTRENAAAEQMRDIMRLFSSSIGELTIETGWSGADVSPMRQAGVMLMGHRVEGSKYFDYHHTHADTVDKIDPDELSRNVAVMATVAYVLADMPERVGGPPTG